MQRAAANFERTNSACALDNWGPGLGSCLGPARVHLRKGPVVGAGDRGKGRAHSGISETLGGPRRAPIRSIINAWRPLAPPFLAQRAMACQFPLFSAHALGIPPRNLPIAMRGGPM